MIEPDRTNEQLNSALISLQSNLTQLKPLLVELKMKFTDLKNQPIVFSKELIQPCQNVIQSIVDIFKPIENIYKHPNPQANFDHLYNKLITDTTQLISSNILKLDVQIPLVASYIPLLIFYFQTNVGTDFDNGLDNSINTLFFTFHQCLTTKLPNVFKLNIDQNIISLQTFLEAIKPDEQFSKATDLVEELLKSIKETKDSKNEKSIKQLNISISSFRANIIPFLQQIYQNQEIKLKYLGFSSNLKSIEHSILTESRLSNITKIANEIIKYLTEDSNSSVNPDFTFQKFDLTNFFTSVSRILIQTDEFSSFPGDLAQMIQNPGLDYTELMTKISEVKLTTPSSEENPDPSSEFKSSLSSEDSDIRKASLTYIANQLPILYKLAKSQQQPSILVKLLSSLRKIRTITKFCKENDDFITLYEYLVYILLLPDTKKFYPVLHPILAENLPSRESVSKVLNIAELESQANELIVLIANTNSNQLMQSKLSEEDVINQNEAASISVDLARPIDALQSLNINLRHAVDFMEFFGLHESFLAELGSNPQKEVAKNHDKTVINLTSCLLSLLQSQIRVDITEEFMKSWISLVTMAMTEEKVDFSEIFRTIPFIDYSNLLMESTLKCCSLVAVVQNIVQPVLRVDQTNFDYHQLLSNTLSLQIKFFDYILSLHGQPSDVLSTMSATFENLKKIAYDWVPELLKINRPIVSILGITSILQKILKIAGISENSEQIFNIFKSNLILGVSSSFSVIKDINLADKNQEIIDKFVDFDSNDLKYLLDCKSEKVDELMKSLVSTFMTIDDIVSPVKLYDSMTRFLYTVAGYASSPFLLSSKNIIKIMKEISKIATEIDDGLRSGSRIDILYFQACIKKMDFNNLNLSNGVDGDLSNFKLNLSTASEASLITMISMLSSTYFNIELDYNDYKVPYEDICQIPQLFSNSLTFLKSLREYSSDPRIDSLINKIKQIIQKHTKKDDPEIEELDKKTQAINDETKQLIGELSHLVKQYNELLGDGFKVSSPPYDSFQQLDKLQVEASCLNIEGELLKIEVKSLEKEVERMKMIAEKYNGTGERSPQVEAVKRILREVTRPKLTLPDDSAELSQMFEKVSAENERLLDELTKMQRGVMSHEDQLDMLLIKSDEIRNVQTHTLGKEETDAIKRQIQETQTSIQNLKRKLDKGIVGNPNAQLKNFLRHSRELAFNDSKPNVSSQRRFLEETMESAERLMNQRNELIAKRNALLEKAQKQ
ncbi:hypothetical protein TVAG_206430 [Trichomonas vaginalis G3]|uniref:Uncharacterized protein n=1 Tax=Trichomonas vaginalis (strain ATCC PRA-98 / G3) TaxID=412133 RepID=A2E1M8_TRIV3|nr:hypothetical protein TVAGG3_0518930 [Trichomonas vaginalis G3]EAY13475.1 hypothetical protein TVAG_206430 [Trichomonas vaginalis G3]KAI5518324.1 hypothetical protein TVAGG3_0518930 [Trichomonas vaginalis G3]|eukprot:XP_001325698.1 hypothetical protein [Trichomonas vaginalis G3]